MTKLPITRSVTRRIFELQIIRLAQPMHSKAISRLTGVGNAEVVGWRLVTAERYEDVVIEEEIAQVSHLRPAR